MSIKSTRAFLDKLHPHFAKGGRYEVLYPVFEMVDTFIFAPADVTAGNVHVRDAIDLKRVMTYVWIAALPCMLMALFNTGYQANHAMQALGLTDAPGWRGAIAGIFGFMHFFNSTVVFLQLFPKKISASLRIKKKFCHKLICVLFH